MSHPEFYDFASVRGQAFPPLSLTNDCHSEPVRARKLLIEQTAFLVFRTRNERVVFKDK